MRAMREDVEIVARACPLFVPLAEEGWAEHPVTSQVAEEYLKELIDSQIDTLVLGCTHYPILRKVIQRVMGDAVDLIDSGEAVAEVVAKMLEEKNLVRSSAEPRNESFYVTDSAARFRRVAEIFLGRSIESLETISLGQL
jgi:glutamate racemase